jgi:hypothetical protein
MLHMQHTRMLPQIKKYLNGNRNYYTNQRKKRLIKREN